MVCTYTERHGKTSKKEVWSEPEPFSLSAPEVRPQLVLETGHFRMLTLSWTGLHTFLEKNSWKSVSFREVKKEPGKKKNKAFKLQC